MSEEENKALETIKEELQDQKEAFKYYKGVLGLYSNGKVETLLKLIDKQKNEIEEKTTILLAGAEKVKELEKGNHSLMESRKKWKDRYYKERAKNKERDKYNITTLPFEELKEMIEQNKNISIFGKEYINKDKVKEMIEHYNNELEHIKNGEEFENEEPMYHWGKVALENLLEEG